MYTPKMSSHVAVEALGTFWLVCIGCGSAMFAATFLVRALDGQTDALENAAVDEQARPVLVS